MVDITNAKQGLRLASSHLDIYNILCNEEKLFNSYYHLFSFALVYGILFNKKKETKGKQETFVPLSQIIDQNIRDVIQICYIMLDDGREMKEIFNELLSYADGGLMELNQIQKTKKSFMMPNLILDAEKLWVTRVKDMQNINLTKS